MSQRKSPVELVSEFVDSLAEPGVVFELLIIALAIAVALMLSRHVRKRRLADARAAGRVAELGRGSVRRLTFPLTAMLLVLLGRGIAHLADRPDEPEWHGGHAGYKLACAGQGVADGVGGVLKRTTAGLQAVGRGVGRMDTDKDAEDQAQDSGLHGE